jgi:H+/gluconate symporter-like permease
MNTNGLLEVFGSLFPILFIGVIVIIITTNVRRSNKIKKLKSGEIASKEIK